jgi:hypothetical protein
LRSEEIENASWGGSNVTVSSDAGTSPAGTTTADAILETVDNGVHERRQSVSIATTGNHTYSVFLKANGRDFVTVYVREGSNTGATYMGVTVNLSDGTIIAVNGTASITSVGNGWYRVAVSGSVDSGTRWVQIRLREDASTTSYAGDITKGILAWGAQLEAGAFPTSYIPTTTAAATRAADSALVTSISSFYNQAEGTLFAENSFLSTAGTPLCLDNNGTSDRYLLAYSSNVPRYVVFVSSNAQAQIDVGSAASAGDVVKHIGAYALNDFQAARGGTLGTADTSGNLPVGVTHLRLGRTTSNTAFLNGHIRKVAYWPKRLTNTLLEQLTT